MFFAEDRLPIVQQMILADNTEDAREGAGQAAPHAALGLQGPLRDHGRLPGHDPASRPAAPRIPAEARGAHGRDRRDAGKKAPKASITKKEKLLHRVEELHELNPMLGHRGCRLGIVYPEITRMQTRAIIEAACELAKKGKKVVPEIMVPLVGIKKELQNQKELIKATAEEVMKKKGVKVDYLVGTMIELPRAAMIADEIAKEAEFFSFGTNDLTQTTFGFSRDDAGKFINYYTENDILEKDPFQTLDQEGVGQLVKIGVAKGRGTRPNLKVGICGEHGGDPASVEFCYRTGSTT